MHSEERRSWRLGDSEEQPDVRTGQCHLRSYLVMLLKAVSGSVLPPKAMWVSLVTVAAWGHVGGFSEPSLPLSGHVVV